MFSMSDNPSLESVDSEYDMGSAQRDLNFLEDSPSLKDIMLANQPSPRMTSPFISLRPANPAMQALSSQKREAHNRSPVSFREGRRASDTSLTQGKVFLLWLRKLQSEMWKKAFATLVWMDDN
jgi:serine/threonine-protein kinase SIK2